MRKKAKPVSTILDRDDHLLRLIVLVVTMFTATATGKIILGTALLWWGPK